MTKVKVYGYVKPIDRGFVENGQGNWEDFIRYRKLGIEISPDMGLKCLVADICGRYVLLESPNGNYYIAHAKQTRVLKPKSK